MSKLALLALALLAPAGAQAQSFTMPPPAGVQVGAGAYNTSPPTCVNGTGCMFQVDVNGNLKIVSSGTPSGTQDVNLKQVGGVTTSVGHGTADTATQRVELPSDGTGVVGLNASTANVGNIGGTSNVTPTDCSGSIASGAVAQNAFTAQAALRGYLIMNIDTTEGMWISFTTTAAASTTGSYFLGPASTTSSGGSFSSPLGYGQNTALSVVAATTSHKFSCTRW